MLLPSLVTAVIILGAIVYYIYILGPKLNPLNRAETFMKQGMVDEAVIEYKKLLEHDPKNFIVHYKLADIFSEQEKIDLAVIHLEEIINIGKFNYEVEKVDVQRKLASAYMNRGEIEKAFQLYLNILMLYPVDQDALYQAGFIALTHEYFDIAYKFLEKLSTQGKKSFEILFAAGMAAYIVQKTSEAVQLFREALAVSPLSDIGNLAMAFALEKKRDFKTAVNHAKLVSEKTSDSNAMFVARRLLGILLVESRKADEAIPVFESLLDYAKKNDMPEETVTLLYDIGFAAYRAEKANIAYKYWNQLYEIDKGYRNVQWLITILRKEMDSDSKQKLEGMMDSVSNYADEWLETAFPENYIWRICGLRSDREVDLKGIIISSRIGQKDGSSRGDSSSSLSVDFSDKIDEFLSLDNEKFRIISSRIALKLGYNVDQILPSYKDSDGVDFFARNVASNEKTLIWVRRWQGNVVGEIPLRNFAQAINDAKCKQGLFITTGLLTPAAEGALQKLSKVNLVPAEKVAEILMGLL